MLGFCTPTYPHHRQHHTRARSISPTPPNTPARPPPQNQTTISQLRSPGNDDCLYDSKGRCVPASTPFRYHAKITGKQPGSANLVTRKAPGRGVCLCPGTVYPPGGREGRGCENGQAGGAWEVRGQLHGCPSALLLH